MIKKDKLWSVAWSITLGGFLIAFSWEGRAAVRSPVFGGEFLQPNSSIVVNQLREWGIHETPSWGKHKIGFESGQEFDAIPPRDFLRNHPQLSKYRVVDLDTKADLIAFIAYRLLEKYNQHDPVMNITDLSQIKKLLDNDQFKEVFIKFLRLQQKIITLSSLENDIVDASREQEGRKPEGVLYPVQLGFSNPIRVANRAFLKQRSEEADRAWKEVIDIRTHVLERHH